MKNLSTLLLTLLVSSPSLAHNSGIATDPSGIMVKTGHGGCLVFGNPEPGLCESMLSGKTQAKKMAEEKPAMVEAEPVKVEEKPAMVEEKPVMVKAQPVIKQVINLKGVTFKTGSDELNTSSNVRLDTSARDLNDNPELKVIVAGHTDNVGNKGLNQQLSEKRAQAVREYLISKGVDGSRLMAKGYGDAEPAASNDTAQDRAQNRRVELRIIE